MLETRKQIIDHRATTSNQAFKLGFCEKETIKMMRGRRRYDQIIQRERERGQGLRGDENTIGSQRERERGDEEPQRCGA
jgi:isopenicillin N synthase-like dioxygenase